MKYRSLSIIMLKRVILDLQAPPITLPPPIVVPWNEVEAMSGLSPLE
jgi:hypothetical protein